MGKHTRTKNQELREQSIELIKAIFEIISKKEDFLVGWNKISIMELEIYGGGNYVWFNIFQNKNHHQYGYFCSSHPKKGDINNKKTLNVIYDYLCSKIKIRKTIYLKLQEKLIEIM